jgi:hypothetical protein
MVDLYLHAFISWTWTALPLHFISDHEVVSPSQLLPRSRSQTWSPATGQGWLIRGGTSPYKTVTIGIAATRLQCAVSISVVHWPPRRYDLFSCPINPTITNPHAYYHSHRFTWVLQNTSRPYTCATGWQVGFIYMEIVTVPRQPKFNKSWGGGGVHRRYKFNK